MSSLDYFVLDGSHTPKAVEWRVYVEWMKGDFEKTKRVAKTEVGEVSVSTVFLSIDHNWGDGRPILFETMIFGGSHDEYQWRYATWDEAVAGHEAIVAALRDGAELPE